MKEKEVTYDDTPSRKEARILWKDMGSNAILKGGPLYDVDLVSNEDYDLEIGESSINHDDRLYRYKELRIEKRKLRYWKRKRKCHYIIFNDQLNDAIVFPNSQVRKWIEKYPIENRDCNGWDKKKNYFLIIPPTEKIRRFKKINNKWTKCD